MKIFTTKQEIRHYPPTKRGFFSGYGGIQKLVKVYMVCGLPCRTVELDREDVPHYHYVQRGTLGFSEWKSRLIKEQGK